jgi:8-oxo-dGTP pyrophosphatase MutT (NUDIX family)
MHCSVHSDVVDTPALVRQLCAELAAREPVDDRERRSIERFVEEVDGLADPFNEDGDPVHVTGSTIVVGARGVILHKHRALGLWIQPGGHIDDGETPWEAAVRETIEETGLPVRLPMYEGPMPPIAHVDVHPGPRGHTHLDLRYLVECDDVDPDPPPEESPDVYWFGWDDAIERADEGLRGALIAMRPDR